MDKKKCNRCKKIFPVGFFYKDASRYDGLLNRCKECHRLEGQRRRENNPQKVAEKSRRYYIKNREVLLEKNRARYKRDFFKNRARDKVSYALYTGKLVRPNKCQFCSKELPLDGHHRDYSKPLEVIWLCRRCHLREDFSRPSKM